MAYIEREKAIDEIDKWLDSVGYVTVGKGLTSYGELIGCLEDTPAADVVEVKHGYWEQGDYYDTGDVCSECEYDSCRILCKYKYCPHCGAKMDGRTENNGNRNP